MTIVGGIVTEHTVAKPTLYINLTFMENVGQLLT